MHFCCSSCRTILGVDDVDAGIMVRCSQCNSIVQVPPTRLSRLSVIADDFVIQRLLGQGGMGSVYLAHQISLDRLVALKILAESYEGSSEFVARFINEARAAAKLNHPHIVQAYAVGEDNGLLYFAMENVNGETMKTVLDRMQYISVEHAMNIIQQIAEALNYAWTEQKIIHCDIKPDNIMLTGNGKAKLADLGLARCPDDFKDNNSERVWGTPQYISPEAMIGAPLDTRSDIYSLGATFYQFITGQFPFTGNTNAEIARKHVEEPLIPPKAINPDIPENVSHIVIKMMAKNPIMRYQNAAELIDDLRIARRGSTPLTTHTDSEILSQNYQVQDINHTHKVMTMTPRHYDNPQGKSRDIYDLKRKQMANAQRMKTVTTIAILFLAMAILVGSVIGIYHWQVTQKEKAKLEEEMKKKRELERETPLTEDVNKILTYEKENPTDASTLLAMCEEFLAKEYSPTKPKEEEALAKFEAVFQAADEMVMNQFRDSESRRLQRLIAQRKDDAENAEQARIREEKLQRDKQEAEEWKRRENENREEKLAELAQDMERKLTNEKEYYAGRMIVQTLNGHLERVEDDYDAWYQTIIRQSNSSDAILVKTAQPFRDWAKYVLDCIASAKLIHENTYNGNTLFAGTQVGYGKSGLCKIKSINNGVITAVPSAGEVRTMTFKFDSLDARQRLVLLKKAAGEASKSDQLYFYLLLYGDFVNAKALAKEEEEIAESVSYIITCYFKYLARDYTSKQIEKLRSKYGSMKEFQTVFPK